MMNCAGLRGSFACLASIFATVVRYCTTQREQGLARMSLSSKHTLGNKHCKGRESGAGYAGYE